MANPISTNLVPFGPCADRFCPGGYREALSIEERIRQAGQVQGLEGVELHYPTMFVHLSVEQMKGLLEEVGLKCALLSVNVWESKWAQGAFTHPDEKLRREALGVVKEGMEASATLGANRINLWLGQDGFDYPFQVHLVDFWGLLVEGIKECGAHAGEVQICLEYKVSEPRSHLALSGVGKVLWLANKTGQANVGVNLDVGHALQAGENPAEAAVLLHSEGRLFHLHLNDNYGDWDWDLLPGSVRPWELFELLFWLEEIGYKGWLSLDMFPPREDPRRLCEAAIARVRDWQGALCHLDRAALRACLLRRDYLGASQQVSGVLFGSGGREK